MKYLKHNVLNFKYNIEKYNIIRSTNKPLITHIYLLNKNCIGKNVF